MAQSFNGVAVPADGARISYKDGNYQIPDNPIVPFIEGDGTGRDIWKASVRVFNAAVEKAYKGKRRVAWYEVFAGEKAKAKFDTWLPDDTVNAVREFRVAIKGPLTTPVGGGIRSLNVALRQILDLYGCVRPVKYYKGVPSPVKHPERMVRADEPFIAVEVGHVMRRQQNHIVLRGIEMSVSSIDHVSLGQGHAALGLEIRNYEFVTFAGIGFYRDVLGE